VPSPRRAPQRRRPVRPLTGVLGDLSVSEG
jgi:hypothetical protein